MSLPTPARDRPRCSVLSEAADEPLAGTAPTDARWLFVEVPGAWGRKAVTGSGLPDAVVEHLTAYDGRVQLVRRPGPARRSGGVQVVVAGPGAGPGGPLQVTSARLERLEDLRDLTPSDLAAHEEPLWLVCTNGRRDLCCAERGRPVAMALAALRPDQVWETSHLGGHRYAATALHLPSGLALGRLDPGSAVAALVKVEEGRVPLPVTRGRVGTAPAAQAAELALRERVGWAGLDEVVAAAPGPGATDDLLHVDCTTPAGRATVTVRRQAGAPGRASCADDHDKAGVEHVVVEVEQDGSPGT